jgi:hypothetical protein
MFITFKDEPENDYRISVMGRGPFLVTDIGEEAGLPSYTFQCKHLLNNNMMKPTLYQYRFNILSDDQDLSDLL